MDQEENEELVWWQMCHRAKRAKTPLHEFYGWMTYLTLYPLGPHNRQAAEAAERSIYKMNGPMKDTCRQTLRELRQKYLPKIEPNTWSINEELA